MAMSRSRKTVLIITGILISLVLVFILGVALLFAALRKSPNDVALGGRLQEADQDRSALDMADLGDRGSLHFEHSVRLPQESQRALHDRGAGLFVGVVADVGGRSGARLDRYLESGSRKPCDRVRDQRDPAFVGSSFLRGANLHKLWTLTNPRPEPLGSR